MIAAAVVVALAAPLAAVSFVLPDAQAATVGQGFSITASDLDFILEQIKIAEYHSVHIGDDPLQPCKPLLDQIGSPLLAFGLRTVDGSCNNLQPGQEKYGAADQTFPRLTAPVFVTADAPGVFGPPSPDPTTYDTLTGNVVDGDPRLISNLIVDQTSTNPAAVAAAGYPVRSQGNEGAFPCDATHLPPDCVPEFQSLPIENITTDVGLSPPFNSLFTIFGQFFDHGLDKITNGGNGFVFVPLKADDPLIAGKDHIFGNGDDLAPNLRFMMLTRGTVVNDANGVRNAPNTDSPFVDQSQTYTSHASHQAFLREYVDNSANRPVSTGLFLSSTDGGLATWAMIKQQARLMLGLDLQDSDVGNIPMLATDPYGKFIPGPVSGLPMYVTGSGLIEGNRTTPVAVPADAARIGTAFLNDIAHSAAPTAAGPDVDLVAGLSLDTPLPLGTYDNELLDLHFICGDGRCNENIALSAIHQVFHSEHDRLIADIQHTILTDTSGILDKADWQTALGAPGTPGNVWNGERLFQAARFVTEMEYQHLVFEEFARKVQPLINPFQPFAFNQTDVNPAITAEFAHAVYRFGHSMLTDNIPRTNADGSNNDIPLLDGFLNPAAYYDGGTAGILSSEEAAGAIFMGLSDEAGQEIDEFVVDTLRNNLLGLPLDLPAINMTRARSEGIPPLNQVRRQIFGATNDSALIPYTDWIDFGQALKHPESLVNFVAAYGTHSSITGFDPDGAGDIAPGSIKARRIAADRIVNGTILPGPDGVVGDDPNTFIDESTDDVYTPIQVCTDPGPLVNSETVDGCGDDSTTVDDESVDDVIDSISVCTDPGATTNPDAVNLCGDNVATFINEGADDILPPADSADFLFSTGGWTTTGALSATGVDDIDLWVGGLAEKTSVFGGLLGSTFNYVFENQLTNLQNGDRFYYLARTPGMNLRAQLEGNSFAELVMRNTNAHSLKADPFATADCKFELNNITSPAPSGSSITGPGSVSDDPLSECNENKVLIRMADGTIRYRDRNSVDPPGINGQSVFNGKPGNVVDRMYGGNDSDTFWGGDGNDVIDGGDGADIALGGNGNDIITDFAGDDVPKGGPGNDAIDGGPGLDIIMGGDGNDFTNGGANINETFGGQGDDFAIAGQGEDAVFGDSGDDWEEGGDQPDLLIGDSSTLFFDDHNVPGHDILIGQGGDDDYDGEGGDDVFVAGPGVEKNAGASGYDWSIGLGDPQPQNADLNLIITVGAPPVVEVRDKFNEVEALSGWNFDDVLKGDDIVPGDVGGGGFIGCDALDAAGVARIAGLDALVPAGSRTRLAADIVAASASRFCLLSGTAWGEGNILLGGAGSDRLEGRGANDILDGDRYMNVRLSIRSNPANPASEIGSTDLMEHAALTGTFGQGTGGMTLQQAVFKGLVDPGNIVAVRELLNPGPGSALDVAVFSGLQNEYIITPNIDGSVTVEHAGGGVDGIDTLWNMERLSFCQTPGAAAGTCDVQAAPIPVPTPTPPAPIAEASTDTLVFGNQTTNTLSGIQSVTISNIGDAALVVSSLTFSGADGASFSVTSDCTSVAPGASCTANVRFGPLTVGAKSAFLLINHNAAGSPTAVFLTGTALAPPGPNTPVITLPANVDFGTRRVGALRTQNVRVRNTGPGPLLITGVTVTGRFTATLGTCPASLPVNGQCNLTVTFAPDARGPFTGTLTVLSNAVGNPRTVPLIGQAR